MLRMLYPNQADVDLPSIIAMHAILIPLKNTNKEAAFAYDFGVSQSSPGADMEGYSFS